MKLTPFKRITGTTAVIFLLFLFDVRADGGMDSIPARPSPDWLRDSVVYEIFPRDFSPAGNFDGITAKLDELHSLGVNILWLMPIHPIGEKFRKGEFGSPYSVKDYYAIDPAYGTPDDFKKLVVEAHKRDMKVIMDLVANHTAWDSVMMVHPEFYKHNAQGKIIPPVPEWTDVAALNYTNALLRQYMIGMLKYWVQTYGVDGFRCDSAAMVPTDFWEEARTELAKIDPDIIMLAEASKPELLMSAFDMDYSWPLLGAEDQVLINGAPALYIRRSWEKSRAQFPRNALHMEISDDHDEPRAINRYGLKGALAASALIFTLDGVPLIYNGMEIGDVNESSGDALFKKENISWQTPEDPDLRATYGDLIRLRHEYPALRNSHVEWLRNSDETNLLTYIRADDKDELLIVINFSGHPISGKIDLKNPEGFTPVKISGMQGSNDDSPPTFHLNGFEWRIFHRLTVTGALAHLENNENKAGGQNEH
ncbi:MAG TPA: alpha-amylase family glycosyl hydrolase [Candidatus Acidoferrales bacterium]|nr:alpha-amylase family glycosyl hydrolase [Candidatus Acidoferrales bacterium]